MNIPEIRRNLEQEKRILTEIRLLQNSIQSLDIAEKNFYTETINSLRNQLRMLNSTILPLVGEISFVKALEPGKPIIKRLEVKKETKKSLFGFRKPFFSRRKKAVKSLQIPKNPVLSKKISLENELNKKDSLKIEQNTKEIATNSYLVKDDKKDLVSKMDPLDQKNNALETEVKIKETKTHEGFSSSITQTNTSKISILPKVVEKEKPVLKTPPAEPVKIKYLSRVTEEPVYVTISAKDREKFAKELRLSEINLAKLRKKDKRELKKPALHGKIYAKFSNKVFSKVVEKLIPSFKDLKEDLKKSNIRILLPSYIAMALMTSSLLFGAVLILFVVLFFINPTLLLFNWYWIFLPIVSLVGFYIYPALQKGSVEKGIAGELPFATIYMGAIAGSNVEPIRIFKIITQTDEYPVFGSEVKKIINQVELYGADLVTALKSVAQSTTNRKFSELLGGMATNILSGGSLKTYLEKKSENFLMDYKLEREKYSAVAGTFMDIYISVLITAPLILMMVFVVIMLTGMKGIPNSTALTFGSIGLVTLANLIFLTVLHLKQPAS